MGAFKDSIKEEVEKYQQNVIEKVKEEITKQVKQGDTSVYIHSQNYEDIKLIKKFLRDEGFKCTNMTDEYLEVSLEDL